ncbi:MAG: futalosine hydrolase [Bryobacteraceae bacterium]
MLAVLVDASFATLCQVTVETVVCVATDLEGAHLREQAQDRVRVLCTGVGAVNAAIALTRFLEHETPRSILVCGIAGAYPQAFEQGLSTGGVVCASSECYGDLGANSPGGFLDMQALGFPLIPGNPPVFNTLPLQIFPVERRAGFVTVNMCTGDDETAQKMEARTGCSVENMEGAAIAHVARLYGIPCGEVRGISNRAGNRDRSSWRVKEAAAAAQNAVIEWLRKTL